jgi:hypothetical protein
MFLRLRWTLAGVVLALLALGLLQWQQHLERQAERRRTTLAESKPTPKSDVSKFEIRKLCLTDQPAELWIGTERLFVNLRVLESLTLADGETWSDRCPTAPIRVKGLWFYIPDNVSGPVYREKGLRLFYLKVQDAAATSWHGPIPVRAAPDSRITIEGAGTIDHVSEEVLRFASGTQSGYSLQHLNDSDGVQRPPFEMLCSGDATHTPYRSCRTIYLFDKLVVRYEFTQSRRNPVYEHYDIPPAGAIQEPEGLLEFDRRVRDWIIEFKQPPSN